MDKDDKDTRQPSVGTRGGASRVSSRPAPGKQTLSQRYYGGLGSGPAAASAQQQTRHAGVSAGSSDPWAQSDALRAALGTGSSLGGLKPGANKDHPEQNIGGNICDTLSDIGDVVGTAVGNVVGGAAALLTGINITASDTSAADWRDHGEFVWDVGFSTTGRNGWIVQEITNTFHGKDSAGSDLTMSGVGIVPHYYEAWAVNGSGNITPSAGGTHDMWRRIPHGPGSEGHWSMRGKVYWTTTDPATQGMTPGGVSNAGILLSSTSAPAGLGVARLHRYAHGTWDSTGPTPVHTGSAS